MLLVVAFVSRVRKVRGCPELLDYLNVFVFEAKVAFCRIVAAESMVPRLSR
jgi:hypothetical protein